LDKAPSAWTKDGPQTERFKSRALHAGRSKTHQPAANRETDELSLVLQSEFEVKSLPVRMHRLRAQGQFQGGHLVVATVTENREDVELRWTQGALNVSVRPLTPEDFDKGRTPEGPATPDAPDRLIEAGHAIDLRIKRSMRSQGPNGLDHLGLAPFGDQKHALTPQTPARLGEQIQDVPIRQADRRNDKVCRLGGQAVPQGASADQRLHSRVGQTTGENPDNRVRGQLISHGHHNPPKVAQRCRVAGLRPHGERSEDHITRSNRRPVVAVPPNDGGVEGDGRLRGEITHTGIPVKTR